MSLNISHWLISEELEQMGKYLDLLHTAISDNQNQLDASIKKFTETLSTEDKKIFYESYENEFFDEFFELNADFPRLLFSSFVVSWYSFVETNLVGFCRSRKLKISISIQDNENYGEGIRRAYNFLNQAAYYQIDNMHWQELTRIGKTRNKIVHNNGILPFSLLSTANNLIPVKVNEDETIYVQIETDLYQYLQKHNLLEYRGLYQITPTFKYCKHLVDFGLEFFGKLHKDFSEERKKINSGLHLKSAVSFQFVILHRSRRRNKFFNLFHHICQRHHLRHFRRFLAKANAIQHQGAFE